MAGATAKHIDPNDSLGKVIGVLTAVLAILLSVFTICAHRAHGQSIELQNEVNDQWAHYQGKRIRDSLLETHLDLLRILSKSNHEATKLLSQYMHKHAEYTQELLEIKQEAFKKNEEEHIAQKKALYFDFAEGVLEISLVMSSLYFITQKRLFPTIGILFGILGVIAGLMGFFL